MQHTARVLVCRSTTEMNGLTLHDNARSISREDGVYTSLVWKGFTSELCHTLRQLVKDTDFHAASKFSATSGSASSYSHPLHPSVEQKEDSSEASARHCGATDTISREREPDVDSSISLACKSLWTLGNYHDTTPRLQGWAQINPLEIKAVTSTVSRI